MPRFGPRVEARLRLSNVTSRGQHRCNEAPSVCMSAALLEAGVLKESDWCGDFDRSIRQGLHRWVNTEMGCDALAILKPLRLMYADDMYDFSEDVCTHQWQDALGGTHHNSLDPPRGPEYPVGFLALSWENHAATTIFCRKQVLRIEDLLPRCGYMLLDLLQKAFWRFVNGHTFDWGAQYVDDWYSEWEDIDPRDLADDQITPTRFADSVPWQTYKTPWDPVLALAAVERCHKERALKPFKDVLEAALALDEIIEQASVEFLDLDHTDLFTDSQELDLMRHPTCYLAWDDPEEVSCPMHRIIDDFYMDAMNQGNLTGFAWLHGFQLGWPGKVHAGEPAKNQAFGRDCRVDGSIESAIRALRLTLHATVLMDEILAWLDDDGSGNGRDRSMLVQGRPRGRTLAEQARRGQLGGVAFDGVCRGPRYQDELNTDDGIYNL